MVRRFLDIGLALAVWSASGGWSRAEPPGRVTLPQGTAPGLELQLFHSGGSSTKRPAGEVGEGLTTPAGRTVAALWNRKSRKYVALSRPFDVRPRETLEAPFEPPGEETFLVAQLQRDRPAETEADLPADLVLRTEGAERLPDLSILAADRVHAFWYGLAPGAAELRGESRLAFLAPWSLTLQPGRIERLEASFQRKPALDVQLGLPPSLRREGLALEIRRLPGGEVLDRATLGSSEGTRRFERLPAALLEAELRTSLGAFSRQVDLTSGQDGFLLLEPELITLTGTVFLGDEGHPAKLTFANAERELEAKAEADGRYEVVSLEPLVTVTVELDEEADRTPYFEFFRPAIGASRELDFRLAAGNFGVRVVDAVSGKGIPGATVKLRNGYVGEEDGEKKDRAVFQSSKTDETGLARLPPLREGTLEIRASAEGYREMGEPLRENVLDPDSDRTLTVLLEPESDTAALLLLLPGGAPAAGAQVLLVDSLATGRPLFSSRADGEGKVGPPGKTRGVLLVRHPAAAFLVREWRPLEEDEGEIAWSLTPPAGRPLILQVRDSSGTVAAARAGLALWIEGRRLSGPVLAWLAEAEPMTDGNGLWMGRNLPPAPVQVLAWGLGAREEGRAGHLDGQATGVQFPWPDPVKIRAVE